MEKEQIELLESIIELLEELRDESIYEIPSMRKQITDSFHMVIEFIRQRNS
jgi:hypothetical protein